MPSQLGMFFIYFPASLMWTLITLLVPGTPSLWYRLWPSLLLLLLLLLLLDGYVVRARHDSEVACA